MLVQAWSVGSLQSVQSVLQSVLQGVLQGVLQSVLQGVLQSVLQGELQGVGQTKLTSFEIINYIFID